MTDPASGDHDRRARQRTDRKALGRVSAEQAGRGNAQAVDHEARDHGERAPSDALLDSANPDRADDGEKAADNHHRRVDPAARAVGQQAERMDADVEALTNNSGRLDKTAFASPVKDFYLTNPIARASAVMAECSALARNGFKQAAE